MCTIMTITNELYDQQAVETIINDCIFGNDQGWCLILVDQDGNLKTKLNTMELEPIWALLDYEEWHRMFLHARYATGGSSVTLANTHGWESNGIHYMHNGTISSRQAEKLPVDSMQIGKWLEIDLCYALDRLNDEYFANVFLIDEEDGQYWVHRSQHNTLFTDGKGNYSTNEFGEVCLPVGEYTQCAHDLAYFPEQEIDDERDVI